eukprot:SAG22_NODE_7399_length_743_cov_1.263975_1_plen_153_part_10
MVKVERYRAYFGRMGEVSACVWVGAAILASLCPAAGRFVLAHWSELPHCDLEHGYGNTTSGCLEQHPDWDPANPTTSWPDEDCCAMEGAAACADPGVVFAQDLDHPCAPGAYPTICQPKCTAMGVGASTCCQSDGKAVCPLGFFEDDATFCPD